MNLYTQIRTVLEKHVFGVLSSPVSVKKVTVVKNDRGERVSETVTSAVVYDGVRYRQASSFITQSVGTFEVDDNSLVLPYSAVVGYEDQVVVDGVTYAVSTVDMLPNSENCVAVVVGLKKPL